MLIDNPWFYAVAIPAILLTGAAKGGLGTGLGILAVPAIALTLPIGDTAGILLPILLLMDAFGLWAYRGTWDGPHLRRLVPAALSGIALGALLFHVVPEAGVRLLIGLIAVGFTLHRWWPHGPAGAMTSTRRPPAWAGWLWGGLSGFTSTVAHAGGPPVSVYLLPQRLDKTLYTGTTVVYFAVVNVAKLVPYAYLGLLSSGNLATALVLSPLAPLGIGLGVWLHSRLSPLWFYRICYGFVFVAGLKLLWDGATALLAAG